MISTFSTAKRLPLFACLVLLASCGPAVGPDDTGGFGLDLFISRAVADRVGAFQVAVLPNGRSFDCNELVKTCLKGQVSAEQLAKVTGPDGKPHPVALFEATLGDGGTVVTQDVVVGGIPVGKDYAVVIEALTRDSPRRVLGSSCNYQPEIRTGSNERLIANAIKLPDGGALGCDAEFE